MLCDYEHALGYWSAIEADESDGYDPLRAAQGRECGFGLENTIGPWMRSRM